MVEAACAAAFGGRGRVSAMFALDRVWDTPGWLRAMPLRRGDRSAALTCPRGDLSLGLAEPPAGAARAAARPRSTRGSATRCSGIIELDQSDTEQARSRALCEAAIRAGGRRTRKCDFRDAVPTPRHRLWAWPSRCRSGRSRWGCSRRAGRGRERLGAAARALAAPCPGTRSPRSRTCPSDWSSRTASRSPSPCGWPRETVWHPGRADARLGEQAPVAARLEDGRYAFACPAQIDAGWLEIRIGDARGTLRIEPTLRPELTSVVADVTLPDYLGRPRPQRKDVRGGAISLVKGSRARFAATASRDLATAQVDGQPQDAGGRDGHRARQPRSQGTAHDRVPLAGHVRPDRQGAVHAWRSPAATTSRRRSPARTCRGRRSCSTRSCSASRSRPRTISASSASASSGRASRHPVVSKPAKGERILAAGGQDKEYARARRHLLGEVARHRAAADPGPRLRRGLSPRPAAGLFAAVHASTSSTPSSTPSGSPSS